MAPKARRETKEISMKFPRTARILAEETENIHMPPYISVASIPGLVGGGVGPQGVRRVENARVHPGPPTLVTKRCHRCSSLHFVRRLAFELR